MGLISWYRDVWYRYFHGMTYDECVECEEEPKTYVDVNGNEYDTSKHDFMKDWIVREREVESKLREEIRWNKVTFGNRLREKTEQNRDKVGSSENKCIDDMYSKIEDMLMEEASQGKYSKSITGSEFEEIFGFQLLIGSSSPTSFWGCLKKKCNSNGFDIEHDGRLDVYTFSWGRNTNKTLGDELREMTKESQKEKKKEEAGLKKLAKYEAEILFDYLKEEFISEAERGRFSWSCDVKYLEVMIERNNLYSDEMCIYEELIKICKRNKIETYTELNWEKSVTYKFHWE